MRERLLALKEATLDELRALSEQSDERLLAYAGIRQFAA